MADTSHKLENTVMNTHLQFRALQKKGVQLRRDVADTLHEAGVCLRRTLVSGAFPQQVPATAGRMSK